MREFDPCDAPGDGRTAGAAPPYRIQVLGSDHLDAVARDAATNWAPRVGPGAQRLIRRLRDNERVLNAARTAAAATAAAGQTLSADAEWLLDNFFVIEEVFREIRTDLPRGYAAELPVVAGGPWAGHPRIYALAVTLISHTDSHLDEPGLLRFVKAFQDRAPLTIGELWAVPTMLRLALLENLRRLAAQMLDARTETARAEDWVARAAGPKSTLPLPDRPTDTFLVAWHKALRDREGDVSADPLLHWLARHEDDLTEVLCREHRRQAANQVSVGNCVTSLRLLKAVDWSVFFEAASQVEEVLRAEPTGVYARQEFATRDRYRKAVEELARAAKRDELGVARAAVAKAGAGAGRAGHVGYHLVAEGRTPFARDLGCRFPFRVRWRAALIDRPHLIYFGGLTLLVAVLVAAAVFLSWTGGWLSALVAAAVFLPATDVAVGLMNYVVCRVLRPRVLPKLDFTAGLPADCPTVVVIPGMLFRPGSADQLGERLELHYLASPDPLLRFALLTDWADAPAEHMPEDDEVVRAAVEKIARLNERHSPNGPPLFFLFHRARRFNPAEGRWIGWERKRGKLDEFNALLRGATGTSYVVRTGDLTGFNAKYVLTLDADTVLPRDAARRLIATLDHPLNRPVLSADGRRVDAGYGVLQPRVSFLYKTGMQSRFARIFAGSAGIDPYSSASSDVYQDLFGWGTFTGKGLYDLDAFAATAGRAFPDNHVLSHDLIESNFARCGLVTDVEVFDDFPARYHAYARREHRWVRGDWQLLPWLGRTAPRPEGRARNPVTALGRWKILDNLRRSLSAPALILLLVLAWTVFPGPAWAWSLAALAALALPLAFQLTDTGRDLLRGGAPGVAWRQARLSLGPTALQVFLAATFLANQAAVVIDAILRTLYRRFVSHKHLLEWETAAAADARLGNGLAAYARFLWPAVALALAVGGFVAWAAPASLPAALPWVAAWAVSPVVAFWVSRPRRDTTVALTPAETADLRRTARKTWRFFETFVTAADHWLPPDNYQEDPKGEIAHRTSPTNKGLLLLSTLSAHDLGYIPLTDVDTRVGRTFDTLDQLKRFRGHFLNWYETRTLAALPPEYVSTVDSGNLLACLLTLKHGLAEKADTPIPNPAAPAGIRDTLHLAGEQLAAESTAPFLGHFAGNPTDLCGWDEWYETAEALADRLPSGPEIWSEAVGAQVRAMRAELAAVCPWVAVLRTLSSSRAPGTAGERGPSDRVPSPSAAAPSPIEQAQGRPGERNPVRGPMPDTTASDPLRGAARPDDPETALTPRPPDDRWAALLVELNTPTGVRRWAERLPELQVELANWAKGQPAADHEADAEALADALGRSTAPDLAESLAALGRRADGFADAMDFRFLYNEARHLFTIGYNVPLARLDAGHYDLIASEACITSFLAVARGVVPRKHWFQLGRLTTRSGGLAGLLSWGGTMFEYLMPRLLLPTPAGTMLETAQRAAVARQIEFGRANRVPWGISESGFYVLDAASEDYQYQSFGVPGLGIKRGLARDLVVAPYATLLATAVDARAAVANFKALRAEGGEGPYGFYEALDFTPDRLDKDERRKVVKSYMAHHQGMGLCAITNRLTGDVHVRRLRAEPAVRAAELLLHERVPLDAPDLRDPAAETETAGPAGIAAVSRRLTRPDTPAPRPHLLSNGHYTVLVTNAGAGYSTCRGIAVTRWRADPTLDDRGTFLYVRDAQSGRAWSAGHQPVCAAADFYEVTYSADKAEFRRRDGLIETFLEVTVAPDRDVEVRRLTMVNHDSEPRTLEVTSYVEVVLNDARADLAHPAFGKLFLETEWLPKWDALLCRRRPRSPDHAPPLVVHVVAADPGIGGPTQYETDRARFIGRRRTTANPEALTRPLARTVGAVLDPVFALRKAVRVAPGASATLTFATAVAVDRAAAEAVADHYHHPAAGARAFDLAWANSRVELADLGITPAESHLFQRLAGHVLFPPAALRATAALATNRQGQPGLWRYGISGDLPILLVRLADGEGLVLARQALRAHAFWRGRGFQVDLVLLADRPASYREELYEELTALARASDSRDSIDKPGGVFVRKTAQIGEDRALLLAAARVVLYDDRGTLADQTDALPAGRPLPPKFAAGRRPMPVFPKGPDPGPLAFANGVGGLTPDGREYVITGVPPAPWANVLANPHAGCLTTDSGLGATWAGNSQANRLTPWTNDPVGDPPAEAVYLRDEDTGRVWSPTPLPAGAGRPTVVRHGAGYTTYQQTADGLTTELTVFVPADDPVKVLHLRIAAPVARRLSVAYFAEWVLGTNRDATTNSIVTWVDQGSGALFARNPFNAEFGSDVAFADSSLRPRTMTGDRLEFLGRNRSAAEPAALGRTELSGHVGPGLDPCAALMGRIDVPGGGDAVVVFVLGQAVDVTRAAQLAAHYREPETASRALHDATTTWDRRLATITVKTPDPALDALVNRWLPYQVLACRLWGRTAVYQSGGAFGFRDQLQDVLALLYAEPAEARAHLLRAAARQFQEGDAQHWWHPPSGRGVRTRFSDDFLWLPLAAARYVEVTGDTGVMYEEVPYLRGPPLKDGEHESYYLPDVYEMPEPLYVHCLRALDRGWALGAHGLPLMGCGDWNDGMNLVGAEGKGESVWVAWFQIAVRNRFAVVAEARGDIDTAKQLRSQADQLHQAVEDQAWDGDWYLRAWFDDGTPLGSKANDECRIDSLPQSWAVLSGAGDPGRSVRAVTAAVDALVDRESKLVKLFQPPFDKGHLQPGYIKGYVPGIRENGGQYTHAAIWLVQALAGLGRGDEAHALWRMINPLTHTDSPAGVARYRVEPYVVAADVYGVEPHVGRGGWTWYTGSAAWLYRAALETILGFRKEGERLSFDPCVPADWPGFEVTYHHGRTAYRCVVDNAGRVGKGVAEVRLDGAVLADGVIPLSGDGRLHEVRVRLG